MVTSLSLGYNTRIKKSWYIRTTSVDWLS